MFSSISARHAPSGIWGSIAMNPTSVLIPEARSSSRAARLTAGVVPLPNRRNWVFEPDSIPTNTDTRGDCRHACRRRSCCAGVSRGLKILSARADPLKVSRGLLVSLLTRSTSPASSIRRSGSAPSESSTTSMQRGRPAVAWARFRRVR